MKTASIVATRAQNRGEAHSASTSPAAAQSSKSVRPAEESAAAVAPGALTQLTEIINGSAPVQRLAQLKETFQQSSRMQGLEHAVRGEEEGAVQLAAASPAEAPAPSSDQEVVQRVEKWQIAALAFAVGAALAAELYRRWPAGRSVTDILSLARKAGPSAAVTFAYLTAWDSRSVILLAENYGKKNNNRSADDWVTIANLFPANSVESAVLFAWIPNWSTAGVGQLAQAFLAADHDRAAGEWAGIARAFAPDASADVAAMMGLDGWVPTAIFELARSFSADANGLTAQEWTAIALSLPADDHASATTFARIRNREAAGILQLANFFKHKSYGMGAQVWVTAAEAMVDSEPAAIAEDIQRLAQYYGPNNADFVLLLFQQQGKLLTSKASDIVDLMGSMVRQLPEVMQTPDNFENLKLALVSAKGAKAATKESLSELDPDWVQGIWEMLRKNLIIVEKRVRADWKNIQSNFGINGKLKFIHLTGSDFHNEGQSVSIAESNLGEKVVYKPRSLAPDKALTEEGTSVFFWLNKLGADLPTTRYADGDDQYGQYGYMQFLEQAPILTEEQAQQYYVRMGQLAVAAKLLGVTDLHQDNVLTGQGAPFLIDTETSFLPYVMLRQSFTATGLDSALKSFTNLDKVSPNAFLTESEQKEFEEARQQKQDLTRKGFVEKKRRAVLEGSSPFTEYLLQGIDAMLEFVKEKQQILVEYLLKTATSVKHVRVVPIDTLTFKGFLRSYYVNPGNRTVLLQGVVDNLHYELEQIHFVPIGEAFDKLPKGIQEDFDRLDIPIFHYEPQAEGIFYKGTMIAQTKKGETLDEAIPKTVKLLTTLNAKEVLESYASTQ